MSASPYPLDELALQSHQTVSRAEQTGLSVWRQLWLFLGMMHDVRRLLKLLHRPTMIQALQHCPEPQLRELVQQLSRLTAKIDTSIAEAPKEPAAIARFYRAGIPTLSALNESLKAHVAMMANREAGLELLTERDEKTALRLLSSKREPNAAMRRLFGR